MIERMGQMPEGTVGLRASGKLTRDDYRAVLEPAINEGIAAGELRLVFEIERFEGLEADAVVEDMRTGLKAIVRDHSAWRRFALVTDIDWLASAFRMFAWMTPGEERIFGLEELAQAKEWVSG